MRDKGQDPENQLRQLRALVDFANAAPPTTATSRKDEERDCCRFVALNLDLPHGERSPPVERARR